MDHQVNALLPLCMYVYIYVRGVLVVEIICVMYVHVSPTESVHHSIADCNTVLCAVLCTGVRPSALHKGEQRRALTLCLCPLLSRAQVRSATYSEHTWFTRLQLLDHLDVRTYSGTSL